MDAPELPEWATRDIGPLPVWGWLVAGVGGFVLSRKLKGGGAFGFGGKADDSEPAEAADGTAGTVDPSGFGGYQASGAGGSITSYPNVGVSGGGGAGTAANMTNDDWRALVVKGLSTQGFGAIQVDGALTKYLAGEQLNATQAGIVDRAISVYGFPPNPPTLVPSSLPSTPDPTVKPGGAVASIGPDDYLVRPDDGDPAIFLTDYVAVRWISDGHEVDALGRSGQVKAAQVLPGIVIPYDISRSRLDGLVKIGQPPQYPRDYKGPRTSW